jgi:hypothetical protein
MARVPQTCPRYCHDQRVQRGNEFQEPRHDPGNKAYGKRMREKPGVQTVP